jgi:1,4-dihydroxy-2-naphthoyl-CoA hydrolase
MIWHKALTTEMLNSRGAHTMVEYLDIRVTEVGADFIVATMPVDHRTKQPAGLLHGGASVVLAIVWWARAKCAWVLKSMPTICDL